MTREPRFSMVSRIGKLAALAAVIVPCSSFGSVILWGTEKATAGQSMNLVGDSFTASTKIFAVPVSNAGKEGSATQLQVLVQSNFMTQVKAAATLPAGLWRVYAQDGTKVSNSWYINKIRPYRYDVGEIAPSGNFRVYGRNMKSTAAGAVPTIRFVASNGASYAGAVKASSDYYLDVRAPGQVKAGTTYDVYISNGGGGTAGETKSLPLKVRASGPDSFGLGVPWAADFTFATNVYNIKTDSRLALRAVGDGVTNDARALQGAIDAANRAGGGVVYFPAGTYKVDDGTIIFLKSNVVLKGAGMGATIFNVGAQYTISNPPKGPDSPWMAAAYTTRNGLCDMTIINKNTSTTPYVMLRPYSGTPYDSKFFSKNVDWQMGTATAMGLSPGSDILLLNSKFTSHNPTGSALYLKDVTRPIIRGCQFSYDVGRIEMSFTADAVMEGNTFTRDNHYAVPGAIESGGIQTSGADGIVIMGNTIQAVGPFPTRGNADGEMIMSQRGTLDDFQDLGTVTSATSTTLKDMTRSWRTDRKFADPKVVLASAANRVAVAIVGGKGIGQWRRIISNTSNTLTVDKPWTVLPDSSSTYDIQTVTNYQQLIIGNSIVGSNTGISMYDGAIDTIIDSNQLLNTGYIALRGSSQTLSSSNWSTMQHCLGWGVSISNNSVVNTNAFRPAQIFVVAIHQNGVGRGNVMLGNELTNNYIQATSPNTTISEQMGGTEGFWNHNVMVGKGPNDPGYTLGNVGTIYTSNRSQNITSPYHFSKDISTFTSITTIQAN